MNTAPDLSPTSPRSWRTVLVGTPLGWTVALAALGVYPFTTHGPHLGCPFQPAAVGLTADAPVHASPVTLGDGASEPRPSNASTVCRTAQKR